ncbi:Adenylate cyclase [Planctomycetales bacterium 10988]|nr:Adenylate cyclase [Planctomycetales bacterium 10988]
MRNGVTGLFLGLACVGVVAWISGCGGPSEAATGGISPQKFADAVHAVMMADRTVYATHIVTRLKEQEADVYPSEYWEDEPHTLPLPAQMFRMGAEMVSANPEAGFTYALKSKWPLNAQNKPATELETTGLTFLAENPGENYYAEEELAGKKYYTAFYPDTAVAKACWDCHNNHENRGDDYPEFEEGDVMGGVIVRIPLE